MDISFILKSVILQLVVFSFIPFLYWLIRQRKTQSFFRYLGLYRLKREGTAKSIVIFFCTYIIVYGIVHFTPISELTQPSANIFSGVGVAAVIPALLVSFVQQALAEEILFRGFIGKRLISRFGLNSGNIIQASIFGFSHVVFSISEGTHLIGYVIIFLSTMLGGLLLGYLDEKTFNGSIIPSILLHGFGNFIMVLSVAF